MNEAMLWQDQLLTTKFFVPASPQTLISRPRLTALLDEGLQRKLTLLSVPAGFGKTTLLSEWVQTRAEEGRLLPGSPSMKVIMILHATSILERLSAPLCDALMEQADSQQVLEYLERANLFVVSLDTVRRWYRYHTLFAEALRYRLQQLDGQSISLLHLRAGHWYAEQGYLNEAIQHALLAQACVLRTS